MQKVIPKIVESSILRASEVSEDETCHLVLGPPRGSNHHIPEESSSAAEVLWRQCKRKSFLRIKDLVLVNIKIQKAFEASGNKCVRRE